jgi:ribosomal protein S27E
MPTDSRADPETAFAALGNEIRVTVLRVLAEFEDAGDGRGLSFTEIYDRVDIDSTSQLSYHLEKLDGVFLRSSPDGYVLTQAGDRIVRAVRSGTYTERPSFPRTELDGRCPACPTTTLVAAYHDPLLEVRCADCETTVVTYNLPPAGAVDRTPMEILRSCDQRVRQEYATALQGTCATCGGRTDVSTERREGGEGYLYVAECRRCQHRVYAPVEVRLLYHPAVVSFYWDHGVDASAIQFWDLVRYLDDWQLERVATGPDRFHATVACEDDRLRLAIDGDLDVSVREDDDTDEFLAV